MKFIDVTEPISCRPHEVHPEICWACCGPPSSVTVVAFIHCVQENVKFSEDGETVIEGKDLE